MCNFRRFRVSFPPVSVKGRGPGQGTGQGVVTQLRTGWDILPSVWTA